MKNKKNWTGGIATMLPCLVFVAIVIFHVHIAIKTSGVFTYPLDDAYIHMSISRTLMQQGVWGITPYEFTSTSSSILYTLLLSVVFKLFGTNIYIPLAINILAGFFLIYWLTIVLSPLLNQAQLTISNLAWVFLVPIAGMCTLGMEHVIQIGCCTVFFWFTYSLLNGTKKSLVLYFMLALLCVMIRYESLFLIGLTAAMWALVKKKWAIGFGLVLFMLLPVIVFGIYSLAQGGFFLPNSLLAKSQLGSSGVGGFIKLSSSKFLFNSLPAALLFFPISFWLIFPLQKIEELHQKPLHLCWLILGLTVISHVMLANLGWMFRYESYLIALTFFTASLSLPLFLHHMKQYSVWWKGILAFLSIFLCFSIVSRFSIIGFTNRAIKNIHDQQWQMGSFVAKYFPGKTLAIGDIGAVSFLNPQSRIMDLEGLASNEILLKKNSIDSNFLKSYATKNSASIGLFYTHLYKGKIPNSWELLGTWNLTDNFVGAGAEVGIFALDNNARDTILMALKSYQPSLPVSVISGGRFKENRQ